MAGGRAREGGSTAEEGVSEPRQSTRRWVSCLLATPIHKVVNDIDDGHVRQSRELLQELNCEGCHAGIKIFVRSGHALNTSEGSNSQVAREIGLPTTEG